MQVGSTGSVVAIRRERREARVAASGVASGAHILRTSQEESGNTARVTMKCQLVEGRAGGSLSKRARAEQGENGNG